jgi:hypothetical protein
MRCVAACLALTVTISASATPPRIWAWTAPSESTGAATPVLPLVMTSVSPQSSATALADEVCNQILALGLGEGEVAITILGWGRGSLVHNPADALVGSGLPDQLAHGVPWTANGVAQMSAWTDAFIARYKARQSMQGIASPSRFHMDSELRLPTLCYLPNIAACWETAPLEVFAAMQQDPRWNSEPVRMNPNNTPTLRTVAQAYALAGSPAFDPGQARHAPVNRAWSRWWDGFMREAVDGALDEAFYKRVQQAWPGALCSEFAQTMRLDGGIEPDGTRREYIDFEWWNHGWMRSNWCGRAPLQATALYVFGETFVDTARPFMDEQMRLHRANIDACLHSFGGTSPASITPWLTLPGIALPFGESPTTYFPLTTDEFMRMIALVKSRGIDECMLWPGISAAEWRAVGRAIDGVWRTNLVSASVSSGATDVPLAAAVTRADRNAATLTAADSGISAVFLFTSPPLAGCLTDGQLALAFETRALTGSSWIIEVSDNSNGPWTVVSTHSQARGSADARWIGPMPAVGLISPDGSFAVRMRSTSATAAIAVDLVQAVRITAKGSDLNGDGFTSSLDLTALLGAWGLPDPAADINGDGTVNSVDLTMLLTGWGPCGG